MLKLKEIFEGWGNVLKDKIKGVDPELKNLSKLRLLQCNDCALRNGYVCSPSRVGKHIETGVMTKGCGCAIPAKTLSPNSKCPLGKW
jgi:hypothetical protein